MSPGKRAAGALRIAPLDLDDLAGVAEIERLSFPTPWSLSSFRYEMVENPYATLFGVWPDGGRVVAFACVWVIDQEIKINNIAVHPHWRGRGIGGKLVDHVLAFGREQGCTEATLEVRPSNGAALRLYGKVGFRVVGRRRGYYSDTHEDALVMSCVLAPRGAV